MTSLSAPFPPHAIHWRAQTLTRDHTKALALAYLDARDVMDRLDEVCGPHGWQDSYTETPKGRVICTISILGPDGNWIAKSDGAGDTAVEGEKGGISDAFKRAAVKWGIGRYLYDLGNVWAPCEVGDNKKWRSWKPEASRIFENALAAVARGDPPQPPKPPASVEAFLEGLRAAYRDGTAEPYWKQHWPAVDAEWRPYALEQKEQIKTAQGMADKVRAG